MQTVFEGNVAIEYIGEALYGNSQSPNRLMLGSESIVVIEQRPKVTRLLEQGMRIEALLDGFYHVFTQPAYSEITSSGPKAWIITLSPLRSQPTNHALTCFSSFQCKEFNLFAQQGGIKNAVVKGVPYLSESVFYVTPLE